VPKITLDTVEAAVKASRDSSTGPDGIPFSVYRSLFDLLGPMLLRLVLHLSQAGRPQNSFNHALLFFFPKDESFTTDKLRPISVSNTDNRLVANTIRLAISPSLHDLLDPSQRAFVPGRSMQDNIEQANAAFYNNTERNELYLFLLHDFQKAYDFLSRRYLFSLLARIGTPQWVIHAI
jgi:hypothetical protein